MTVKTPPSSKSSPYDAADLHRRLLSALDGEAPALIFSGASGVGKSTVLAGVPVPANRQRLVYDNENSMKTLDAGPEGVDIYSPRHQKFRMRRTKFPELEDYAKMFQAIKSGKHTTAALVIDNIKLLQDEMAARIQALSPRPEDLKAFLKLFDADNNFPFSKIVMNWEKQTDARFWDTVKKPFANLTLACQKQGVIFIGSTEEGNVWENYGQTGQKIVGKKAKLLDVWGRYTDATIFLKRNANTAKPPTGEINLHQPKMRLQGLNPSWVMDWPTFIVELEAAKTRREEEIPVEAQVVLPPILTDEPEPALAK